MPRCVLLLSLLMIMTGCTSTSTTNTARSAKEQMLVSNAIDQSLQKVNFNAFAKRSVYLDTQYLDCTDKNYLVSSIRHRLLRNGAQLVNSAEEAEIVLEPRAGAIGTHTADTFLGIPEIVLPGMMTMPEIRLMERKNQKGIAKIGMVAYQTKSKTALGGGGVTLAESDDSNYYFMGIGPYQDGTINEEIKEGKRVRARNDSQKIPHSVAFSVPATQPAVADPTTEANKLQLASGEEESAEKPESDAPVWTK